MTCKFAEMISLLIDGALSTQESAETRSHISACAECRALMEDSLLMREALKAYPSPADDFSQRRALNAILSSGRTTIWTRRISLPAPAMALLLITLVALAALLLATNLSHSARPMTSSQSAGPVDGGDRSSAETGAELSRLDHGGRAVIVKARKGSVVEASQPGRAN
jgi:anti-sigma factor RsiW